MLMEKCDPEVVQQDTAVNIETFLREAAEAGLVR
jgi:hypothetical protein